MCVYGKSRVFHISVTLCNEQGNEFLMKNYCTHVYDKNEISYQCWNYIVRARDSSISTKMSDASIVSYNLYKKTREHPFLFTKDYHNIPEFDVNMKTLIRNDAVFFTSVGDAGVFDCIVKNTGRQYKYILIGREYIGCVFSNRIIVRNIVITENSFIDFETRGRIFVDFHTRIGRKNFIIRVAHFYNYESGEEPDHILGADMVLRTYDPVL